MKKFILALPFWALSVILIFFVVSNRQIISISLYPLEYELELPIYFVFFAGLFFGLIVAGILLLYRRVKAATTLYRVKRENERLQTKIIDIEKDRGGDYPSSDDDGNLVHKKRLMNERNS